MYKIASPLHGKPAHERMLEEFIGKGLSIDRQYGFWNEEAFILHQAPYFNNYEIAIKNFFCTKPTKSYWVMAKDKTAWIFHCYSVGILEENPVYAGLLARMIDAENGAELMDEGLVGEFYPGAFGSTLGILASHRGKGVGPQFVAAAIEATGNVDPSRAYSPAGLATRKKAHRILVENAIKRGDSVPMQVLEEYASGKR
jgi:GNAT superfamily N-acetyltransferase